MGSALRRYYEGLWLLLLAAGFFTLASTGRLAWPVVVAAGAAYVARLYGYMWGRELRLRARVYVLGMVLYLPIFAADALHWSGSSLQAGLHWVVLAGAARVLAPHRGRDELWLGLLAFLEVLTAALLTVSGLFFVLFLLFLALLVATLVAHELARAEAQAATGTAELRLRPVLRFSLLLSLAVALCSLLIFFVLPRTALGAWGGRPSLRGLSGFSDEVELGAIASLQRSDTPVMHIRLLSSEPPLTAADFAAIPWRGRGLTHFDGQRWTSASTPAFYGTQNGQLEVSRFTPPGAREIVRYQVTLEPMSSPVLFFPAQLLRASTRFPVLAWDRATSTLASLGADFAGTSYAGVSDLARPQPEALRTAPRAGTRFRFDLDDYLQVPEGLDPRVPALARAVTAHSAGDDYDRMQALTEYLQGHYQYSLEDLPQGPDPLATFLFDQPAGDCEYFATALAVMARTLGIPTRVVNGFVVDSFNPLSGEYIVRGRDAHTWVEAYFPGRATNSSQRFTPGTWVSFDATPSAAAASAWGGGGMLLDALSSVWQEWIVNYDALRQARVAGRLEASLGAGALQAWQQGGQSATAAWRHASDWAAAWSQHAWLAGGAGLMLLTGGGLLGWSGQRRGWWRRRAAAGGGEAAAARRAYRRFQRQMARAGFARQPAQTNEELLERVAAVRPGSALLAAAGRFVAAYQAARFGQARVEPLAPLLAAVRRSRRAG